jgi:hypothetical protein
MDGFERHDKEVAKLRADMIEASKDALGGARWGLLAEEVSGRA